MWGNKVTWSNSILGGCFDQLDFKRNNHILNLQINKAYFLALLICNFIFTCYFTVLCQTRYYLWFINWYLISSIWVHTVSVFTDNSERT